MLALSPPAERVLRELTYLGAGAKPSELASSAKCSLGVVADALCELEDAGLATPSAWAPTTAGRAAAGPPPKNGRPS